MMKNIVGFLGNLIKSDTMESSKRAIAIFMTLIVGVLIFIHTNQNNFLYVLADIFVFILTLVGMAVYQKVKLNKKQDD